MRLILSKNSLTVMHYAVSEDFQQNFKIFQRPNTANYNWNESYSLAYGLKAAPRWPIIP
jgi:hypothetical protein